MGFFWQGEEMIPVTDLDLSIPGGAAIGLPCALGETGQIALDGSFQGGQAIILLTPINQPLGDVNHDCVVGISDFMIVLENWGPCSDPCASCFGDADGDCHVGILDFLAVIGNWG